MGITLNTKGVNTAIAESSKKGGGVVLIPVGKRWPGYD